MPNKRGADGAERYDAEPGNAHQRRAAGVRPPDRTREDRVRDVPTLPPIHRGPLAPPAHARAGGPRMSLGPRLSLSALSTLRPPEPLPIPAATQDDARRRA